MTVKGQLGHQAPAGYRSNVFNYIELKGDFAYCSSHKFVYNVHEEKRKLYKAEPCFHTDNRYKNGNHNYYGNCMLHWTRWQSVPLKTLIRKLSKYRNIPLGTIVEFGSSFCVPDKKIRLSYLFKIRKENRFAPKYEINCYDGQFTNDEYANSLVSALRENGFIVHVDVTNENFIGSMVKVAARYVNRKCKKKNVFPKIKMPNKEKPAVSFDYQEEGETAIAYGYGKKIGFSSFNDTYLGYSDGCNNILWDEFGIFDKWSRCNQIKKGTPINEIIEILKQPNTEDND